MVDVHDARQSDRRPGPVGTSASGRAFGRAEIPVLADRRPICSSKPASQCDEPGTVGIRQISTADGLTSTADIASPRPVMTGSYAATNSSS